MDYRHRVAMLIDQLVRLEGERLSVLTRDGLFGFDHHMDVCIVFS
jgi:hypothetical protein